MRKITHGLPIAKLKKEFGKYLVLVSLYVYGKNPKNFSYLKPKATFMSYFCADKSTLSYTYLRVAAKKIPPYCPPPLRA